MYLRPVHSTYYLPTLYSFLRANPLGVLTTAIPFDGHPTIQSSHIPWVLDPVNDVADDDPKHPASSGAIPERLDASIRAGSGQPLGILRAHMSRGSPHAKALIAAAREQSNKAQFEIGLASESSPMPDGGITLSDEVLVLFTGPVQHYVTPKFYTTTKPETGKVVPTWNYEAVQAYGKITVYPSTTSDVAESFLTKAIVDLTHQSELAMKFDGQQGRPQEWEVGDAPEKFVGLLKKSIVGVSIEITRLGGKFKMSQEMGGGDREGVVAGFAELGNKAMAESVQRWGKK